LTPYIISLVGLVFDIIGAFLLSIEVIGIKKIIRYMDDLKLIFSSKYYIGIGISVLLLIFAVIFAQRLNRYAFSDFDVEAKIMIVIELVIVLIVITVVSLSVLFAIAISMTKILVNIEARIEKGALGGIGFLFLFVGFLGQFGGTLLQGLTAH